MVKNAVLKPKLAMPKSSNIGSIQIPLKVLPLLTLKKTKKNFTPTLIAIMMRIWMQMKTTTLWIQMKSKKIHKFPYDFFPFYK
jgi:hypothetical protein